MSKYTVHFQGSREQARQCVGRLAGILCGRESDDLGVARGVHAAIGFAALSDIKDDFIRKSRGETGEDGVKWKPLSREYLAYGRRFGRGEQAALRKGAGLTRANKYTLGNQTPDTPGSGPLPSRLGGTLTDFQVKRWWEIYFKHRNRLMISLPPREAKSRAAALAWIQIKSEGAKTKLEVYGNRQVDIGRDTGVLLNSLSPGELANSGRNTTYAKPTGDGGAEQVFELINNGVIVGTNVRYAAAFNKLRPFIPQGGRIPNVWQERWAGVIQQGVLIATRLLLEAA